MTEVREYCKHNFNEYDYLINEPNYLKNQFYPWKRNCYLFIFFSVYDNSKTKNNDTFLRSVIFYDDIEETESIYNIV